MLLCFLVSILPDTVQLPITLPEVTVYPDDKVELLARIIYAEAGNQPYEGMLAVGNVVVNRMEYFEKPIQEVIFKPRQFTGVNSKHFRSPVDSLSYTAAKEILAGIKLLPSDILFYANERAASNKKWIRHVKRFKAYTIYDHNFYYDPTAREFYKVINKYKS